MSVATVAPRSVHSGAKQERHAANDGTARHLVGLSSTEPQAYLASVSSLNDAPTLRKRRIALRAEDPAAHRRPVYPRVTSSQSVESAVLWTVKKVIYALRQQTVTLRHCLFAAAYVIVLGGTIALGLALQPGVYDGPTIDYSVSTGESVWSIAQRVNSDRPLEEVVADIESLNNLTTGLAVGQHLVVPAQ